MAPLLANWFVSKIENQLLNDSSIKQPKFYRRYVDDVFAVFECQKDRDEFYKHLNCAHPNLQFTLENVDTTSNSLPFLDVEIAIDESATFSTRVYRKPTNTGVLLNFNAVAPTKWKKSIIKWFLKRAAAISSSHELFELEVNTIKDEFKRNGYPPKFIDDVISEFRNDSTTTTTTDKIERERNAFLVLPYFGKPTERLHRRIQREFLQHQVRIQQANKTTKVESYFSLKSPIPTLFKSDVVYMFTCPRDEGTRYVGETERQLFQRIKDHCSSKSHSAVFDHIFLCVECQNHRNVSECFTIVRKSCSRDILSEEALYIKKTR
ncbi:MAG: GIY-YIG nuclease family protein, partial [Bacteroidota bacterium]